MSLKAFIVDGKQEAAKLDESSPFDWKNYKPQINMSGKTSTGHTVKKTSTGTAYTKDHADHEEAQTAHAASTGETPVKRGRGRPPGKYGSYKARSAETNVAAAAKAAASKAANKTKVAESIDDIYAVLEEAFSKIDMSNLTEEQLDELSKSTLASYVGKANYMSKAHDEKAKELHNVSRSISQARADSYSHVDDATRDAMHKASVSVDKAASKHEDKSMSRRIGANRALKRLAKEDVETGAEVLGETFKVGDTVTPKIGPHAGHPHLIIAEKDDGTYNIKPKNMAPKDCKYRLGAANAKAEHLSK